MCKYVGVPLLIWESEKISGIVNFNNTLGNYRVSVEQRLYYDACNAIFI